MQSRHRGSKRPTSPKPREARPVVAIALATCVAAWVSVAGVALAEEAKQEPPPTIEEGVDRVMAPMTERLSLTDDQQAKIRPMVSEFVSEVAGLRKQYEAEEIGMLSMMMSMSDANDALIAKVDPVLTPEQVTEYRSLQAEQREKMIQGMAGSEQ